MQSYSRHYPMGPFVWYSLGLQLGPDGTIRDVRWGGPADKAKLAPGQKLIAVNGLVFSADALHQAIVDAKTGGPKASEPIHFLMQSEQYITPVDVDYHGGERYPAMVRVEGTKDYLDEITSPLAKHPAPSASDTKEDKDN